MFKKKQPDPDQYNPYVQKPKHNGRLKAFKAWFLKHKKTTIPVTILLLAGVVYIVIFFVFLNKPEEKPEPVEEVTEEVVEEVEPTKYYSPLTGQEVTSEAESTKPINSVILENTPAARPQSGIQQAELVYEAITEGGITRFLAFYQQNEPELIGPVRSLRPFFVSWIAPFDTGILHVGGSAEALAEVRNGNYRDLDQFFHAGAYWRASDRYAPHNVYTNSSNVSDLNESLGYTSSNPVPIERADNIESGGEPAVANEVTINMSGPAYNSVWHYDPASQTYHRTQAGQPHTDREHGQVTSEVVVTLRQDFSIIENNRSQYGTTGTGQANIFYQGQAYQANWHRADNQSQYTYTNQESGEEIKLPRGSTWIPVVPNQQGAVSWR